MNCNCNNVRVLYGWVFDIGCCLDGLSAHAPDFVGVVSVLIGCTGLVEWFDWLGLVSAW